MKIFAFLALILLINPVLAHENAHWQKPKSGQKKFGAKIARTKTLNLNEVVTNFDKYKGQTLVVEATPQKVCKKKGCWMVLKDGKTEVRTLFKDYGFFVPADIVGKKVRVQGKMEQKKVSAATIRHFMKDEGEKDKDIKEIKDGQIKFQFEADAVEII